MKFTWLRSCHLPPIFSLVGAIPLSLTLLSAPSPLLAQNIKPANDGTGTIVTPDGDRFDIDGGTLSGDGSNLFHSLEQFGLDQGQIANFLSNPQIRNILSRVVGGDPSLINGLIQVTGGNSNLYLMNPSGIVFGSNALLNVPANFTATTANGIQFGSEWFNASGTNNYGALLGDPTAFAFTMGEPGSIVNAGNLTVTLGGDLTLLGGTVVNTGQLSAPEGNLIITAVPGENLVRLSLPGHLLSLEIEPTTTNSSQPNEWTFPITSLPNLLTTGTGGYDLGLTVNADGTIQLNVSEVNIPDESGTVVARGLIDSSNNNPGGNGGNVLINGNIVKLPEGLIDISGDINGGSLEVYSNSLNLGIEVNANGINGTGGYVLFDPVTFTINTPEAATIVSSLEDGDTVDVEAESTINVNAPIDSSSQGNSATLNFQDENADNNLEINLTQPIILGAAQTLTGDGTTINVTENGTIQNGIDVAASNATLNISGLAGADTVNASDLGNVTSIIGDGTNDTLVGENNPNTWNIDGANQGNVDGITFQQFSNLTGGTDTDSFTFTNAGSLTGTVDGDNGSDTVDYSAYTTDLILNLSNISNIENLIGGSANDNLRGDNTTNSWNITGNNSGTIQGTNFSSIENLTGGTNTDSFTFTDSGSLDGTVDGNSGSDTLVGDNDGNTFTITGTNEGTLIGKTSGWSNIENLVGGNGEDSFTFTNAGSLDGTIDGDNGSNTLVGDNNGNTFTITGTNEGTLTGKTSGWSNIENLTGRGGEDSFTFTNAGSLDGTIDGGDDSDSLVGDNNGNTFTITGTNEGTLTGKTSGWSNIENLVGGNGEDSFTFTNSGSLDGTIDGDNGSNTLVGDNNGNTFTITGTNEGTLTGKTSGWSNIENLFGRGGEDSFTFTNAGSLDGTIDGGDDSDSLVGDDDDNTFTITGSNEGTLTGKTSGWSNIENLFGRGGEDSFTFEDSGSLDGTIDGGNDSDSLVGDDDDNTFTITGSNEGTLEGKTSGWSNIENLFGRGGEDSFTFEDSGSLDGTIDGGNDSDSLVGDDDDNTFTITGSNEGTLEGKTSGWSNIENLTGRGGEDSFTFNIDDGASLSGNLNGGAGTDTLTSNSTTAQTFDISGAISFPAITGAANSIENLRGGTGNDTFNVTVNTILNLLGNSGNDNFIFSDEVVLTGSINGEGGNDTLIGDNNDNTFTITESNEGTLTEITDGWSNIENLFGRGGEDSFTFEDSGRGSLDGTIDGGDDSDSLVGDNDDNTSTITRSNEGTLEGKTSGWSNIENLFGRGGEDSFTFNIDDGASLSGNLNGGAGTDTLTSNSTTAQTFDISGAISFPAITGAANSIENLRGGTGNDTFNVTGNTILNLLGNSGNDNFIFSDGVVLTGSINGEGGNDTLIGDNNDNTFTITESNEGTLTEITNGWSSIENLFGRGGEDSFTFNNAGSLMGTVDGGDGDSDTLVGDENDNTFTIDRANEGTLAGKTSRWSNIENLSGRGGEDSFTFTDSGSLTGTVDGGDGDSDTLVGDDDGNTFTITESNEGTLAGKTSGWSNIENLTGGNGEDSFTFTNTESSLDGTIDGNNGSDSLVGDNDDNTFTITRSNEGTLEGKTSGWSNIENLFGTGGEDSFTFTNTESSLDGTVDGGDGDSDTLVGDENGNTFTIDETNEGTLEGKTSRWSNIENLSGRGGEDSFTFTDSGSLTGTVDGDNGSDTLTGDDDGNTFTITGNNQGTLAGKTSGWSNIENLSGGTDNDNFIFSDGATLAGIINGEDGNDTVDYSAYITNLTLNFSDLNNIETLIGGGANNTLRGDNTANIWNITGTNSGTVQGTNFSNIENLAGGTSTDEFIFTDSGSLSGTIDGDSGNDTLVGDDNGNTFTITGSNEGTLTGKTSGWSNIENLSGGGGEDSFTFTNAGNLSGIVEGGTENDTVIGDDDGNTFTITGENQGTLAGKTSGWSNIENLTGGTNDDNFIFSDGAILAGIINGEGGNNTVDYSAYTSDVVISLSNINNIETLIGGSANDTLRGDNIANIWNITGVNSGTVQGTNFSDIENVTGGTETDSVTFTNSGSLDGTIDGDGGNDTLVGDDNGNTFTITGENEGTLTGKTSGWSNIENLTGGNEADSFTFDNNANLTGNIEGQGGELSLIGDEINYGGTVNGTGILTIDTITSNQAIAIGGDNIDNPDILDLTEDEINSISDNFDTITIGSNDNSGEITVEGSIEFNNPLLTLQSPNGGSININGQVTGLGNTSVTLEGDTNISADITTANQNITINGNATLGDDVELNTDTGEGNISFTGSLDGNQSLSLEAGEGNINFAGAVGENQPLNNIQANSSTQLNGDVTTSNSQSYGDQLTLNGDITLTGDELNFSNSVSGRGNLTLQPFTLNQDIQIGSNTDSGNNSILDLTNEEINQLQEGFESLTFGREDGNGLITIDSNGLIFSDTVTLQSPDGSLVANGEIIGTDNASITINSTTTLNVDINTNNQNITIEGDTILGNNVSLNTNGGEGDVNFNGNVNGTTAGGENLTISTGNGNINFEEAVGNTTSIGNLTTNSSATTRFNDSVQATSLTTDADGITEINGDVITTGNQTYNDPINLTNDVTLNSSSGNGNITFNSTVDGTTDGNEDLTVLAGSGNITFEEEVGRNVQLGALTANSTSNNTTRFNSTINSTSVTTNGGGTTEINDNITTTEDQTYDDRVLLTNDVELDSSRGNGNISFNNTVDGVNPNSENLTLTTGSGNITFGGAVGNNNPLDNLTANSSGVTRFNDSVQGNNVTTDGEGTTQLNGDVTTSGSNGQNYNDEVEITNDVTLTSNELNFANNISGSGNNLTLQPLSTAQDIDLGGTDNSNSNILDLTATEIEFLQNGFDSITIGHGDGSGEITLLSDATFNDPLILRSPSGSGTIDTTGGTLSGVNNASITLQANQDIETGNINSQGQDITITSTNGSINPDNNPNIDPDTNIGNLNSSSTNSNGGAIALQALLDINIGDIDTSAPSGRGGDISIVSEGITIPGDDTLSDFQGEINTVNLNSSGESGGNITITPFTSLTTRTIDSSGGAGDGGDVTLGLSNDSILIGSINAESLLATGGDVDISTVLFFVAAETFLSANGTQASISTLGSLNSGEISIAHGASVLEVGNIPFDQLTGELIGSGTAGDIESGDFRLSNINIPGDFQQENIAIVSEEPPPNTPRNTVLFKQLLSTSEDIASNLEQLEINFTNEFKNSESLDLGIQVEQLSPQQIQANLREIEKIEELNLKMALVYANFKALKDSPLKSPTDQLTLKLVTSSGEIIEQTIEGATRERVINTAKRLRRHVTYGSLPRPPYQKQAQQLYQWLIAPIEEHLEERGINNISFLMDSGLRLLPIASLHDGEKFIIEKYSIALMPSFSLTYKKYKGVNTQTTQVLAMGASEFSDKDPLPAVETELDFITNQWQGKSFINEKFTLDQFQEARSSQPFGIVHLATHADFQQNQSNQSYIQFWDSKLELKELDALKLDKPIVELIVLSACRTAVGDEEAELGFAGLAVKAGVKSALASLWYVSDASTLSLMASFYQKLTESPAKAEALRQAQLDMLQGKAKLEEGHLLIAGERIPLPPELAELEEIDWSHPYYWSAFTLIGNPW